MKKTVSILILLILALSIVPMAFADETNTTENGTDDTTEDETEAMDTQYGAEVRLLQLEKSINRNILRGQAIIDETENSTELEAIITELEALKTEVQNADPTAEDAVQVFVDLKKDARNLCKQFRDTARGIIKEAKRAALKERINNIDDEELKERVKSKIRAFNSQRMQDFYGVLGLGEDIVEQIKNGEITAKEAKDQMKEKIRSMTKEEMREAYNQLKEKRIERRVEAKAKINEAKANFLGRQQERLQNRLDNLELTEKQTEQITNRLQKLQEKVQAKANKGGPTE